MSDILDRYPNLRGNPAAMAMMCNVLCDKGLLDDAVALGWAAIDAAPGSTAILTDVTATLSRKVPAFHIPMLLDRSRNRAYAAAITRMVKPGMLVLEIGTGAGLLAMLCARAGAQVVTCEEHPTIAAAAARIIAHNGLSDRITLIRKRSTEMTVPEDLPRQADLVIHEIFGSNLVDEGVTAALTDARERLLKPGALSLPPRAELRCALASGLPASSPHRLADVEGFDLSAFELLARPVLSLQPRRSGQIEQRSDPVSAMRMDYDSPAPFGQMAETVVVQSRGGRIEGIVQWLALDFGNGETLENDPFAQDPGSSWGVPYTPLITPIDTRPGDTLAIRLRHRGTLLTIDVERAD